jgi:catechol 2,3-dioxygenase-like lactoylglutathione lyase family enzyme
VRGLGEIALRVNNLDAMQRFYAEVIGLSLMTRVPNSAFFRIADGLDGHTQVLALFDRSESRNNGVNHSHRTA